MTWGASCMSKAYRVFGTSAVLAYVGAVVTGGALLPGYSHAYNTISELTASNAPDLPLVQLLFTLYNVGLFAFAWGFYRDPRGTPKLRSSSRMLMATALLGLATGIFPQDSRDVAMTFSGKMHIALAGAMSPLTMLAMICAWLGLRTEAVTRKLGVYSLASFVITFVTGGLTAWGVATNSPYGGLLQRLTIGAFLQWVLVMAVFA